MPAILLHTCPPDDTHVTPLSCAGFFCFCRTLWLDPDLDALKRAKITLLSIIKLSADSKVNKVVQLQDRTGQKLQDKMQKCRQTQGQVVKYATTIIITYKFTPTRYHCIMIVLIVITKYAILGHAWFGQAKLLHYTFTVPLHHVPTL